MFLAHHNIKALFRNLIFILFFFLLPLNYAFANIIYLSCKGVESTVNNIDGKNEPVNIVKSYTLQNRRIGSMYCEVWNDENIICLGSNEILRQRTDGKGAYKQNVILRVAIDRISGVVNETANLRSFIKLSRQSLANPYSGIFPQYEPYESITTFNGMCERTEKRF